MVPLHDSTFNLFFLFNFMGKFCHHGHQLHVDLLLITTRCIWVLISKWQLQRYLLKSRWRRDHVWLISWPSTSALTNVLCIYEQDTFWSQVCTLPPPPTLQHTHTNTWVMWETLVASLPGQVSRGITVLSWCYFQGVNIASTLQWWPNNRLGRLKTVGGVSTSHMCDKVLQGWRKCVKNLPFIGECV